MDPHRRNSQTSFGLAMLLTGLVVGMIGSYFDNAAGSGTWVSLAQVFLWLAGGAGIVAGLFMLTRQPPQEVPKGASESRAEERYEREREDRSHVIPT